MQDGFYVAAKQLYIARPLDGGTRQSIDYCVDALGSFPQAPGVKVFIDRSPARGRTISNREELLPLVKAAGYEVVDTDQLSLLQQAQLFSRCSHLLSVHGAGLTNMIFRRGPMQVLEIYPLAETSLEYLVLAKRLGHQHHWIRGQQAVGAGRPANFRVDPGDLGQWLQTNV